MRWEPILFALVIPAVMFILSTLFRGEQGKKAPVAGPRGARPRPRPSDIDRFLEEINRRRRAAAGLPPRPEPPPAPPVRVPQPVDRPARAAPVRPKPVRREAPVEVVAVEPAAVPAEVPVPPPPSMRVAAPAPSAALAHLLPMLRTPHVARIAVLLHEVFGPPVCRRHRVPALGRPGAAPETGNA